MWIEVAIFILSVYLLKVYLSKPNDMPPGEWGYPIIGRIPSQTVHMADQVHNYRKKYGDIFTWRIGSRVYIIMSDYKMIKTAFNTPELNDRPNFFTFDIFTSFKKIGLFNSNGHIWRTNRRFVLQHLRDLGLGKSSLEDIVHHETKCFLKHYSRFEDKPAVVPWSLNIAILNVLWQLVADKHYNIEDPEIQKFGKKMTDLFDETQKTIPLMVDNFPWLVKYKRKLVCSLLGLNGFCQRMQDFIDLFMGEIEHHVATFNPDKPRDLMDAYIAEMNKNKDDPDSTFNPTDLRACVGDLFFAGVETTASTIKWILLMLAKHPEVQRRCQKEIDAAVPADRRPNTEDRENLPYTEATFAEVQRVVTLLPIGIVHYASADVNFAGYRIPKNSIVLPNFEGCHRSPEYWERPTEFYPEHFLDKDGKYMSKREGFMPFSIGKRMCIGESLAKLNIYIIVTSLLQQYNISAPPGVTLNASRDVDQPFFNIPKEQKYVLSKRNKIN